MKRVLACGDFHCGHRAGLTPPGWWLDPAWKEPQEQTWAWFEATVKALQPIDVAFYNGDLIDGTGGRSGSTEMITTDRAKQKDMAAQIIKTVGARKNFITYGTPYHSGQEEDWELEIAKAVGATIAGHQWVDVEGVVFDIKHKVGGSQIPHGRHTAVARERLWNVLWAENGAGHKASVLLRSHVHYYAFCGTPEYLCMTLPALQGLGSKYGIRQCSGIVDLGFLHFDCENGGYTWTPHILKLVAAYPELHKC